MGKKHHLSWFRFDHDMPQNKKVWRLTDVEFRFLIGLWCSASKNHCRGVIHYDEIESELERISVFVGINKCNEDVTTMKRRLEELRLIKIDEDKKYIEIINWNEWQYKSPSSRPDKVSKRVIQHRLRKRETNCNDPCNDFVTPCNAIEKNRIEKNREERKNTKNILSDKTVRTDVFDGRILEIITHLNKEANAQYKPTTWVKLITTALDTHGFTVDQLKLVIDNKSADPYFKANPKYLRPQTLFGSKQKIEAYLNEGIPKTKSECLRDANCEAANEYLNNVEEDDERQRIEN